MGRFASSAFRAAVVLSACVLFAAGPVSAIEHEVRLLLDLDDDDATGCTVSTPEGAFDGVDQILSTLVETTTPPPAGMVTEVSVLDCTNPATDTFGPPAVIDDGDWPVGLDNGVGGLDVVETYFPLISSVVSAPTTVRLGVVVTDELGGVRALLTTDGSRTGEPILLVLGAVIDPAEIPTLGEWGLIVLALGLAAASVLLLGRRGTVAFGLILLTLAAGTAWAAGTLDGQTGDWSPGDELASGNGIVLFGKRIGGDLCFRVDTALLFDQAPTADDQAVSTDEDTPVVIALTGSDPESQPLTFSIVTGPAQGGLTGTPPNVTYTPDADYAGPDSFTFQVEDPSGGTDTGTVSITVDPVNDPPVVDLATFTVDENAAIGTVVGTVTFTDPDPGQSHTFAILLGNVGGAFAIDATTGEITVAAALDFETTPSYGLTVTVTDDGTPMMTGGATIQVNVTDSDDPPTAVDDTATVDEDAAATAIDVLANDTDTDGGPKTIASAGDPANGTVVITGGGSGLTYQPDPDSCNDGSPTDDFTYALNGGSSATVSVTVTCVDDSPVAVDDTATVAEDAAATTIDVLANDTDVDGGPKTIASASDPANGTVVVAGDNLSLTYQPDADSCNDGSPVDTFTYTLNGGSSATVSVTVTCDDDPPTAVNDAATVAEDASATAIDVLANDTDTDGGPKTIQSAGDPANGTVVITGGGTGLTYQPDADYCNDGSPTDDFTYALNGGSSATVSVTVTCSDDPPTAVNDSATVNEDSGANAIDVLANDTDLDGGTKLVQSKTDGTNGTVAITGGGTGVTYTPNANYCNDGSPVDTFTYTLNGGSSATVSVTVTCVDDAPVAVNDSATMNEDSGANAVDVLANDTDIDGGTKLVQSKTDGTNGTVAITGGGTGVTYTPNANYCNDGSPVDTFTYTLNGGSSATVSVTVTCVDDLPVAVNDSATVAEDSGATAIDVLANDTDVDGGPKTIQSAGDPANGTVVITGGGTGLTYQPDPNYCNSPPGTTPDTFAYTLNGGSSATVSVTVTCVDDPPTAVNDSAMVNEDSGANAIDVLANDTDVDGGPKTIQSKTDGSNGTVVITGGGTGLTYQPNANYCNSPPGTTPDAFTYTLNGGASAMVSVTVVCINDPPVAGNDTFDFIGNTELRVDPAMAGTTPHALETTTSGFGLLDNDADPVENDAIFISAITGCGDATAPFDCTIAGVGTFHVESNGRFTFVPLPGDTDASEVITYTLSDGTDTVNGTVTLNRTQRVWYVENDTATAGTAGTSVDPFDTLVEAQTASLANDYIFVHFGDGTSTGQSAGISLKSGQHLLGEHAGLSIPVSLNGNGSPTVLFAATANRPVLGDTAAGGAEGVSAVDVIPAEVAGLSLSGNVNAIEWTTTGGFGGGGTFEIYDNVVTGAGAVGVDVNLGGTGATRLSFHDNSLTATGTALNVQETGAGTVTITVFDDNSVSGATGGSGMILSNAIFDAVPGGGFDLVAGGTTSIGQSGNGVGGAGLTMGGVSGDLLFTDLDVFADAGAGLSVTGTGASNLAGGSGLRFRVGAGVGMAVAAGGPAVSLTNLTADLQLSTVTSTGSPSTGVSLTSVGDGGGIDAVFSAGAGSAITLPVGASGPAFQVSGGNARISYGGTIVNNATAANAVSIASWAGDDASDDLVLSGAIDENGNGIRVTGNGGARAITFSGGLDIDTAGSTAEGFSATSNTNALGVNVTGSSNEIDSVSATALRVTSTPIGSSNLSFRRVSSGNSTAAADPANGIVLDGTGSLGGLKITGTGGAGTGGTIQHATSTGISLTSTRNVELASMQLNDFGDFAIRGSSVVGFSLSGSTINGVNGDNVGASEGSIRFTELTGSASITSSSISGGLTDNLAVVNTSGTLNRITLSGVTVGANSVASGSDGLFLETQGTAVINATVEASFFTSSRGDLAQFTQGSSGSMDVVVQGTAFSDNHPSIVAGGGGVVLGGTAGSMTFNVNNNTFRDATGTALAVSCGNAGQSCVGRVENNQVGLAGTANSGSTGGSGIAVVSSGGGTLTALVNGNQVRQYNNHGILLQAGQTLGNATSFSATVTNNTVSNPGSINTNFNGIHLNNGTVPGENFTSCVDIRTNSIAGAGTGAVAPNNADYRLRQRQSTTVRLPGYGGANNNDAAVVSFVSGNQTTVTTGAASNTVGSGGGGFVGGASCTLPP